MAQYWNVRDRHSKDELIKFIERNYESGVDVIFEVTSGDKKVRSLQQNAAIHMYFDLLADRLNDANLTVVPVVKAMRDDADVPWTPATVKEVIWRPIQLAVTGKTSSRDLEPGEVSRTYEVVNRFTSTRLDPAISLIFPHRVF